MMPAVETAHTVQTNEPATPTDESAQPSGSQRSRYTCPLCKKTMSRRYTVKDHFPACAEKLGNPDNLEWTNDSSTKKYIPRAQSLYNRDRAAWLEQNGDTTGQTERPKKRQRTRRTLTAEEQGVVGQSETSEQSIQPTVQWQPAPNDAGNSTTATPPMIVQLSTGWYQLVPLFQPGVFNVNYTAPGAGPQLVPQNLPRLCPTNDLFLRPARVIDPRLVQSNEPPFAPDASWDGYWPHWPYMG